VPPHRPLRVVVVAEESAGVQALEALGAAPEAPEVAGVVTTTERDGARRPVVAAAAERLGLEVRPAPELRSESFSAWLIDLDVDLLLNVHSLFVLGSELVRAPRIGSFNLHPGPLPEYAGLNAPSWAIYDGRTAHAVTLHWMTAKIDAGATAYRADFPIEDTDTGLSLTAKCVRHGVPLLSRLIAAAAHDPSSIPAVEQDLSRRRYFGREVPNEGNVIWSASAQEVVRFVRAADYGPFESPWGFPRAFLDGRPIGIARASLTGETTEEPPGRVGPVLEGGGVRIAAGDEWIAVHRMWHDARLVSPSEICSPGDRVSPSA
jgi:methionyl-tRNA formyltransferase